MGETASLIAHGLVHVCVGAAPPHPVHVLGAGVGGKHRQDARSAADVQDDLILEHVLVVVHGVPIGESPHLVFQHLLFKRENTIESNCCGAELEYFGL